MKTICVEPQNDGKKLTTYLTSIFPSLNINYVYKSLRNKDIKINGKRVSENIILHSNDIITLYIPDKILYDIKNSQIPIIYEDNNIIIFNKPVNLEVVGQNSLTTIMKEKYDFLEPCHRIDRNTIGLVLYAKNLDTLHIILDKFKNNEIEKHYIACSYGIPHKSQDTISSFLFKDRKKSIVYISDTFQKGYIPIKTSYTVLKQKGKLCLLDVTLHTGKTHQIRAHLSHIGLPIIGDSKYGYFKINKKLKFDTQLLCNYSIKFTHSKNSKQLKYLDNLEISLKDLPFLNLFE